MSEPLFYFVGIQLYGVWQILASINDFLRYEDQMEKIYGDFEAIAAKWVSLRVPSSCFSLGFG